MSLAYINSHIETSVLNQFATKKILPKIAAVFRLRCAELKSKLTLSDL